MAFMIANGTDPDVEPHCVVSQLDLRPLLMGHYGTIDEQKLGGGGGGGRKKINTCIFLSIS